MGCMLMGHLWLWAHLFSPDWMEVKHFQQEYSTANAALPRYNAFHQGSSVHRNHLFLDHLVTVRPVGSLLSYTPKPFLQLQCGLSQTLTNTEL